MDSNDYHCRIRPLKITTVGDGMVGKTCMLISYTMKTFPSKYVPTVFDNYAENITVDGVDYNMTLWDTAGQEDYERLRPLSYPNTNCFIICYSIANRASFANIEHKWFPEIKHFSPTVPIILVATKIDIRQNPPEVTHDLITTVEGKRLKKKIKAMSFVECSALKQENLKEVFEEAVRAAIKKQPVKKSTCFLL